jgi:hypothetical protein
MNRGQWAVVIASPWVLLVNAVRLRRLGYQATLAKIPNPGASGEDPSQQLQQAEAIAYAFRVAVRIGPWWPRCLLRSLSLSSFLSRRDIPFQLRIGVTKGETEGQPGINAHAWVEHGGVVLNDRPDIALQFKQFDLERASGD